MLAQLTRAGTIFRCEFDRELEVRSLDKANWDLRAGGFHYVFRTLFVDGINVVGAVRIDEFGFPGDQCSYFASPPDVRSALGVPADPFLAFPVDVFP